MSDTTTLDKPATMPVAVSLAAEPHFVKGRRDFFRYRDLGVTAATSGKMRAQVTTAITAMTRATGWHYHVCDMQFVYVLGGWVDLEFEGKGKIRLKAGDSVMIPGGAKHQETETSADFEILEVSLPAEMGTVACPPPA